MAFQSDEFLYRNKFIKIHLLTIVFILVVWTCFDVTLSDIPQIYTMSGELSPDKTLKEVKII